MTRPASGPAPLSVVRDLPSVAATQRLAATLAGLLRAGDVVALAGELGAGKTTLARALISSLGYTGDVPSPTFTLVQVYELAPVALWHFDFYRLESWHEIIELGFEEALADAISLVEWPERMGPLLPVDRLEILLTYTDDADGRRAQLRGHGSWRARLAEARDAI